MYRIVLKWNSLHFLFTAISKYFSLETRFLMHSTAISNELRNDLKFHRYVWTLLNELCSLPSGFYESCTHSHTYTRKHKRTHTLYTSLPYVRIQATSFTQRALEHRIWNAHKCVSFTVNCSLHSFGSFCFVRYWRHLLWTEK